MKNTITNSFQEIKKIVGKKILLMSVLFVFSTNLLAQVPKGINYQATVRDDEGSLMKNENVTVEFQIKYPNNVIVAYSETQNLTTNSYGGFSAIIGQGDAIQGNFSTLNWGTGGEYFLTVKINGEELGTSKFQSVPFALQSNFADSSDYSIKSQMSDTSLHSIKSDTSLYSIVSRKSDTATYAENVYWEKVNSNQIKYDRNIIVGEPVLTGGQLSVGGDKPNSSILIYTDTLDVPNGGAIRMHAQKSPNQNGKFIKATSTHISNEVFEVNFDGTVTTKGEVNRYQTGNANLVPIAYGYVLSNGNVITSRSTSNINVTKTGTGKYNITINGVSNHVNCLFIGTSIHQNSSSNTSPETITSFSTTTRIEVGLWRVSDGSARDSAFQFVIYKK